MLLSQRASCQQRISLYLVPPVDIFAKVWELIFQKWSLSQWSDKAAIRDTWARGARAPVGRLDLDRACFVVVVLTSLPPPWSGWWRAGGTNLPPWSSSFSSLFNPLCSWKAAVITHARSEIKALDDSKVRWSKRSSKNIYLSAFNWGLWSYNRRTKSCKLHRELSLWMADTTKKQTKVSLRHIGRLSNHLFLGSYPFDSRDLQLNVPTIMSSSMTDPGFHHLDRLQNYCNCVHFKIR